MKKEIKKISLLLIAGIAFTVVSCKEDEATPTTPETPASELIIGVWDYTASVTVATRTNHRWEFEIDKGDTSFVHESQDCTGNTCEEYDNVKYGTYLVLDNDKVVICYETTVVQNGRVGPGKVKVNDTIPINSISSESLTLGFVDGAKTFSKDEGNSTQEEKNPLETF